MVDSPSDRVPATAPRWDLADTKGYGGGNSFLWCFWMLMGLFLHFYIIFGTNLLTQGLVQIAVFLPISVFRRKGISNRIQTE